MKVQLAQRARLGVAIALTVALHIALGLAGAGAFSDSDTASASVRAVQLSLKLNQRSNQPVAIVTVGQSIRNSLDSISSELENLAQIETQQLSQPQQHQFDVLGLPLMRSELASMERSYQILGELLKKAQERPIVQARMAEKKARQEKVAKCELYLKNLKRFSRENQKGRSVDSLATIAGDSLLETLQQARREQRSFDPSALGMPIHWGAAENQRNADAVRAAEEAVIRGAISSGYKYEWFSISDDDLSDLA